jgi:predicted Zn-dependent peptidase
MNRQEIRFRLLAPLLVALALLSLRAQVGAWPQAPVRFELDNGLAVVCFADANSGNSVVQILAKGGQRLEAPGKQGLTYLTMNLALQVPELGDVQRLMEMGAAHYLNVFPDYALITIQCRSVYLEETLNILARQIIDPLLSGLRINAVKTRLKNSQKQEQDQPLEAMRLAQRQAFFSDSAGAGSVFGNEASLAAIDKKDISALHQALFSSKNLELLVVSDMKTTAIKEILAKTCGRFPANPVPLEPPLSSVPGPFPMQKIKQQTNQTLLSTAFRLPPVSRESVIPGTLLEALLGKGVDSRLWALRSRHDLAYGVYLKTDPVRLREAKAFLDALFVDLRENGIKAAEFAAAQAVAVTEFMKNGENKKQFSALAAHLEGMGLGADFIEEYISRLRALPLDEFNRYLRQVLQSENRFDVAVGPETDGIPGIF